MIHIIFNKSRNSLKYFYLSFLPQLIVGFNIGAAANGLVYYAVSFGEFGKAGQLLFGGIGLQVKAQPYLFKTYRCFF
jgi:hypothetical protein